MSNTIWFRHTNVDVEAQPEDPGHPSAVASDPPLPLSQPSSSRSREQVAQDIVQDVLPPRAQRPRLSSVLVFAQPGTGPHYPGPPLFPPLPTRVSQRPIPSTEDRSQVPFIGDLLRDQANVLAQFLWVGRTEEGGPIRYFEATYEGANDDQYWGMIARPIPPMEGVPTWGHNRWLLGHPRELHADQLPAHIGDMTHRTLRFLHLP